MTCGRGHLHLLRHSSVPSSRTCKMMRCIGRIREGSNTTRVHPQLIVHVHPLLDVHSMTWSLSYPLKLNRDAQCIQSRHLSPWEVDGPRHRSSPSTARESALSSTSTSASRIRSTYRLWLPGEKFIVRLIHERKVAHGRQVDVHLDDVFQLTAAGRENRRDVLECLSLLQVSRRANVPAQSSGCRATDIWRFHWQSTPMMPRNHCQVSRRRDAPFCP